MGYFLFLLVNVTMFLRPAELMPELASYRIYETLILSCLVVSLPQILAYFLSRPLSQQPLTVGVFALLPAVFLSHMSNSDSELALENTFEFAKVVVYFVLLVAVVNSASRLRQFLLWVVLLTTVLASVAILRYYEVLDIKTPAATKLGPDGLPVRRGDEVRVASDGAYAVEKEYNASTGETNTVYRLVGTGIFNDPNELSTVLAMSALLGLFFLLGDRSTLWRLLMGVPLALFLVALGLTFSRGGFLCLMAGLIALLSARFGWRRMLWWFVPCLLPVLVLFAGRMTTISATEGSGQSRIQLWNEGLQMLRNAPLFGVGMDQFAVHVSLAAHNSFISGFAELGLFGGTIFLGIFYVALVTVYRLGRLDGDQALSPELQRLQPILLAVLVAYSVALLSLSRNFVVPTYLVLGLMAAFANICAGPVSVPVLRLELALTRRLAFVSVLFLAGVYGVVRVFSQF